VHRAAPNLQHIDLHSRLRWAFGHCVQAAPGLCNTSTHCKQVSNEGPSGGHCTQGCRICSTLAFLLQRARSAMKAFGCIVHRPPEIAAQTTLLPDRVLADLVGQTWPQNHPKATWGLAPGHKKTAPTDQF
jgi:hypothetical protein